jgi:hypothetical protein
MAGGRYDPGVTEPGGPALFLDGLEAVVLTSRGIQLPWGDSSDPVAVLDAAGLRELFDVKLAERGADVVVAGLGDLLEGAVAGRGGR